MTPTAPPDDRLAPCFPPWGGQAQCSLSTHAPFSHPPPPFPLQVTLEPYERDHAVVVGVYRASKKKDA